MTRHRGLGLTCLRGVAAASTLCMYNDSTRSNCSLRTRPQARDTQRSPAREIDRVPLIQLHRESITCTQAHLRSHNNDSRFEYIVACIDAIIMIIIITAPRQTGERTCFYRARVLPVRCLRSFSFFGFHRRRRKCDPFFNKLLKFAVESEVHTRNETSNSEVSSLKRGMCVYRAIARFLKRALSRAGKRNHRFFPKSMQEEFSHRAPRKIKWSRATNVHVCTIDISREKSLPASFNRN